MVKPRRPLAAYMRVSRVGEREERLRSPVLQREAIERFAQAEGFAVVWFDAELDVSGSKARRPVLDKIIEGVKSGELGGLVVSKLDRLSRMRPKERVLLFEEIEDAGGVILSASEQLDPSTPEGRFARDVFLGVARMQWEKYREGFERAKENAIADGIPIHTRPPVGYRNAGRRLVPDERAAPVVREVFERRARGEGPAALGRFLESRRIRTSQGSRTWSKQAIYNVISNRVYLGELVYGRPPRFVNEDAHEPLVDRATWQAAQHPNGRHLAPARSEGSRFLLTGIARCQGCRYCLQATTTSRGKRIYRCTRTHAGGTCPAPTRVDAELVENAAVKAFWALTRDLEAGARLDGHGALRELEAALRRSEERLAQLEQPEAQDALGEQYLKVFKERREERDEAARQLGAARASAGSANVVQSTETLRGAWRRMTTGERRELLGLRFDCLALGRDGSIVLYPAGSGPTDLPRRGFKKAPVLAPFPDPPGGARVLTL